MGSQRKIVLMACGSFSPPSYMHLRMFEIARDYIHSLGLGSVVGGIVSPVHDAYGKKDLVAAHHRLSMLNLALRSSSWIKVSEWETQQSGWTRTRVSMQYHQDMINSCLATPRSDAPAWVPDDVINVNNNLDEPDNLVDSSEVTVKLLCGADLLESFATPGLWSDDDMECIVGRHGLVVVTRAGCEPGRFIYDSDMLYKYRNNVTLVTNYIINEVSSTVIRRLVRRNESAKYLTDDAVIAYIKQNMLYGATPFVTEYNFLSDLIANDKKSPQDVTMTSPEETSFKNILISIRDKPSIIDETITVKRLRKSNYLMPNTHTDSVSPISKMKPKMAYLDRVPPSYVPGKAVKIVSENNQIKDDKVSFTETTHSSLDSYLSNQEIEYDLYKRRVSEGNADREVKEIKKRCSASTIRKLDNIKKSKSEVSKLCDKVKSMKLKEKEPPKNYKTRSCNDIVRLILTKHGIHVISDTEAIV